MHRKLGKRTDQRLALIYNQASQLLWYGKINTTVERAKEVRRVAEKMITLAINSYEDVITVTKTKENMKGEKLAVDFKADGPKKLSARRAIMARLHNLQEIQGAKESKASYKARIADVNHPLIEKIFNEYAPKYAGRAKELGQGGGYTRIIKLGNRRGDDASLAILELV